VEKVFNKLVRDGIPEKIKSNGEVAETRVLNDKEYRIELYKKLYEECGEVVDGITVDDRVEELGDVIEVVRTIAKLEGKSLEDIIKVADAKRTKRGGFEDRIFLERTIKEE